MTGQEIVVGSLPKRANRASAVFGPPPDGRIQNRCRVRSSTASRSMS